MVAEALPERANGKKIEIGLQDEARVGQKGTLTRVWARRGSRPPLPHDQRYDYADIVGAVCPARDTGIALVMPDANIPAMNRHREEIGPHVEANAHAVILLDGAGWHRQGGALLFPENVTPLVLPPSSPERNAQENVWQYLRHNYLAGRRFETYDDIVDACCKAWNALTTVQGLINFIASRDWLTTGQKL